MGGGSGSYSAKRSKYYSLRIFRSAERRPAGDAGFLAHTEGWI